MKYTVNLDSEGFILSIAHTANDDTYLDLNKINTKYLNAYQIINGNAVLNNEKQAKLIEEEQQQNKLIRLAELHKQLDDTDYKIIKCSEYQLAGLELPYDIAQLHKQRQDIRDEINKYE